MIICVQLAFIVKGHDTDWEIAAPACAGLLLVMTYGYAFKSNDLPELVVKQCIALVQRMQLVSGAIDLAFTQDGRWIFFEVNQSGQFIWLELLVPELPLLDAFCRFLAHGERAFRYTRQERCLSAPDFMQPDSSALTYST